METGCLSSTEKCKQPHEPELEYGAGATAWFNSIPVCSADINV